MTAWLLRNPNPNGPFFYTSRLTCHHGIPSSQLPHVAVIHTAESLPDFTPPDDAAENLARYASSTSRAVSWHQTVDSDSRLPMLPDSYVGFHVRGYNTCSVGVEIATLASVWWDVPTAWRAGTLGQLAAVGSEWAQAHDLPAVYLTKAEVDQGKRGFISHARLDPTRRTDPGAGFPWTEYLAMVEGENVQIAAKTRPKVDNLVAKGVVAPPANYWYGDLPESEFWHLVLSAVSALADRPSGGGVDVAGVTNAVVAEIKQRLES